MKMILIVDDENLLLEMYEQIVQENTDYKIFKATNGEEALSLLERYDFDKVITDFKMPIMNGAELIENICSQDLKVKSILLCSGSRPEDLGLNHLEKTCLNNNIQFSYAPKPSVEENVIEFIIDKSA